MKANANKLGAGQHAEAHMQRRQSVPNKQQAQRDKQTWMLQAPRLYTTLASPATCPVMVTLSAYVRSVLQCQHWAIPTICTTWLDI